MFHSAADERTMRMGDTEKAIFFDHLLKERPDAIREIANRLDLLGDTGPFTRHLQEEASEDPENFKHNSRKLVSALTKMDDASRLQSWAGVDDTIQKLLALTMRNDTADGERLARTIMQDGKTNFPLVHPNSLNNMLFGNLRIQRPDAYYPYMKNVS